MTERAPESAVHRLFEEGRRALREDAPDRAIEAFEQVTAVDESDTNAWFNLGLAYKLKRDWPNSVRCNRRSAEVDPTNQEAFWNLGVAATAVEDWKTARWAWRGIGIDPGSGAGPPELQLGPSPIRLLSGEVVWGDRIDPCRARIANVPLPEAGHRWGDVVLHDVVPRGERQAWGKGWGVFDELIRMEPGPFVTLESEITAPTEQDSIQLKEAVAERGLAAEEPHRSDGSVRPARLGLRTSTAAMTSSRSGCPGDATGSPVPKAMSSPYWSPGQRRQLDARSSRSTRHVRHPDGVEAVRQLAPMA